MTIMSNDNDQPRLLQTARVVIVRQASRQRSETVDNIISLRRAKLAAGRLQTTLHAMLFIGLEGCSKPALVEITILSENEVR